MACEKEAGTLMGYLYGELPPAQAEAFRAHTQSCASCREELASFQSLRATLDQAAPLPDPHPALSERILDAARQPQKPSDDSPAWLAWLTRPWTLGLAVAAAGAAAVLVVGTRSLEVPAPYQAAAPAPATPAVQQPAAAVPPPPPAAAAPAEEPKADLRAGKKGAESQARPEQDADRFHGLSKAKEEAPRANQEEKKQAAKDAPADKLPERSVANKLDALEGRRAFRMEPAQTREDGADDEAAPAKRLQTAPRLEPATAPTGSPLSLPRAPVAAQSAPVAEAAAPEAAAAAPVGSARGGGGAGPMAGGEKERDAVPGFARKTAQPTAKAAGAFEKTHRKMQAQEELRVAEELLLSKQPEEALTHFQNAAREDVGGELAPQPRFGQVLAHARMNQCTEALNLARSVERSHPAFARRAVMLREVAACLERKGLAPQAAQLRAEADALPRPAR